MDPSLEKQSAVAGYCDAKQRSPGVITVGNQCSQDRRPFGALRLFKGAQLRSAPDPCRFSAIRPCIRSLLVQRQNAAQAGCAGLRRFACSVFRLHARHRAVNVSDIRHCVYVIMATRAHAVFWQCMRATTKAHKQSQNHDDKPRPYAPQDIHSATLANVMEHDKTSSDAPKAALSSTPSRCACAPDQPRGLLLARNRFN